MHYVEASRLQSCDIVASTTKSGFRVFTRDLTIVTLFQSRMRPKGQYKADKSNMEVHKRNFNSHSDHNHGTNIINSEMFARLERDVKNYFFFYIVALFQSGMRPNGRLIHTSTMRPHHKWNHFSKLEKGSWAFIMRYFCVPFRKQNETERKRHSQAQFQFAPFS